MRKELRNRGPKFLWSGTEGPAVDRCKGISEKGMQRRWPRYCGSLIERAASRARPAAMWAVGPAALASPWLNGCGALPWPGPPLSADQAGCKAKDTPLACIGAMRKGEGGMDRDVLQIAHRKCMGIIWMLCIVLNVRSEPFASSLGQTWMPVMRTAHNKAMRLYLKNLRMQVYSM